MTINVLAMLLGIYVILEAIAATAVMDRGGRPCIVVRYALTGVCGFALINRELSSHPIFTDAELMYFGMVALALYMWPTTFSRIYPFFHHDDRRRGARQ